MTDRVLVSTAYLPPVDFFCLLMDTGEFVVESRENYIKQSYRNRCYILSAHGAHLLTVPVMEGSRHKVPVKEVRIDYTKRWQQVHLRAIVSSYRCSPYFEYYYEAVEKIITSRYEFLWDLNTELIGSLLKMLKIKKQINFTGEFEPSSGAAYDYRYRLEPAKPAIYAHKRYLQVFSSKMDFVPNLSIIDLIFTQGPDAVDYIKKSLE